MRAEEARALMNAVPMPLVLIGADERLVAANDAAQALFGAVDLAGRPFATVLRHPAVLDCVERTLRTSDRAQAQFPSRSGNADITLLARAEPFAVNDLFGAMVSFQDLSDKEDATQMRRDFVANVSHELRTPLTALIGFIETLQGPAKNDPAAQSRFLGIMTREANRMSRLIRDLLSLSRVEAEERVRPTSQIDLAQVVQTALTTLWPLAQERGVNVQLLGAEAALMAPGDGDQLLQVFTNLIENAIKYGGRQVDVELSTIAVEPTLRGPAHSIDVRDDGEGIDPLHLPRLTERFYRADSHRSREMGGTGLGLAIVKHIVNRHRGRMKIASTLGEGTSIRVILPAE